MPLIILSNCIKLYNLHILFNIVYKGGLKLDTNLRCDSTRCIHNNSNYCYAGRIVISGKLSDNIDDTYCSTFKEKDYQQFSSSIYGENKLDPTTIKNLKCEAINCSHNNNKLCTSSTIKINNGNSSCNMFIERRKIIH